MTLTEYMNTEKFPATSQKGLSAEKQLRLDAFNYDQLEEAIAGGHQMDEEQIQIRKELQAKRPWMAELTRQVAAAMNIDKMPKMPPPTIINEMDAAATEAFDQAFLDRLPPSDRPFMKLSTEQTKAMCEQVIKILKVTREQEERDKQTYREMYGEEMPEM
jgi:hypothetical protein